MTKKLIVKPLLFVTYIHEIALRCCYLLRQCIALHTTI